LLSRCLKTKEMDVEYEKSEEAKKNNNWVLAKEIVTPLAEKGHAKSQGRLGGIYLNGFGEVPKDLKKALKWLKLGAEQGEDRAQYFLGEMYLNGWEVPKDLKQAIKFWELAGDKYPKGNLAAQLRLGGSYDRGKGIPKDPKKAFYWYRLAAEQGFASAQFNLGVFYSNGLGVEQDYKKALKWYTKAAKQGDAGSFYQVGSFHANGLGTKVNFKEAIKWFKLAADQGDADAQKDLKIVENLEKQRLAKAETKDTEKAEKAGTTEPVITAKVVETSNTVRELEEKDDFKEVIGYYYAVKCDIKVEFHNKLNTLVAIQHINAKTSKKDKGIIFGNPTLTTSFKLGYDKFIIKAGKKLRLEGDLTYKSKVFSKKLDKTQRSELATKYGCLFYSGALHLARGSMKKTVIKFKDDLGIKNPFSVLRPLKDGVIPLEETIITGM
jgi:TPR repeat protein